MTQGLRLFQPPSRACLQSLDDVVVLKALLICRFCPLEVAKCSFSEHGPWYFVLTLLLGEMLDVARSGQYEGKLHLICQGWLV